MRARVKSFEEIKKTLNKTGKTERGGWFPASMIKFCGKDFDFHEAAGFPYYDFMTHCQDGMLWGFDKRWLDLEEEVQAYIYALILKESGEI